VVDEDRERGGDKRLALANDLIDFSAYNYYSIMTIVFVS
jgi:hypothetical protein